MAIIALKAWYLDEYIPIRELEARPHDLRLSRNSLLKSGLRADFLDEAEAVREADWFERYLNGEPVEFYIEGSGGYRVANVDLISHEIYFAKQETMASLEPTIFFCYQTDYPESGDLLRDEINRVMEDLNGRSRLPLSLEESNRLADGPARLTSNLMRKINQCLLFIADGTPIHQIDGEPPRLIPSPEVCVELGYALHSKRPEQVLLLHMERDRDLGPYPFDLANRHRLSFDSQKALRKVLPNAIEAKLRRFQLFS
ncbi:MAG: hypothetical protein AAF289_03785 [Cyanobacteria bacterium P01_A01_bin.135]